MNERSPAPWRFGLLNEHGSGRVGALFNAANDVMLTGYNEAVLEEAARDHNAVADLLAALADLLAAEGDPRDLHQSACATHGVPYSYPCDCKMPALVVAAQSAIAKARGNA